VKTLKSSQRIVTGARSLSDKIKNGKIKQSINWGITIDQENQDADDAKLIGGLLMDKSLSEKSTFTA
tara:strand:+ start:97 stop:297 length:201 start_codon:yes stop_codon:yes gene_type:complete